MDILKRIDFVQQFAKKYADGAWSIDVDLWKHHVTPEFIEDTRQYIESLQLKLMYLQTQQAKQSICAGESYDMIDRFLRNNLGDDDYESFSDALNEITAPQPAQPVPDCRTCRYGSRGDGIWQCDKCVSGDMYKESAKVVIWRTE